MYPLEWIKVEICGIMDVQKCLFNLAAYGKIIFWLECKNVKVSPFMKFYWCIQRYVDKGAIQEHPCANAYVLRWPNAVVEVP